MRGSISLCTTLTFHSILPSEAFDAITYSSTPSPSAAYLIPSETTGVTGFGCARFAAAERADASTMQRAVQRNANFIIAYLLSKSVGRGFECLFARALSARRAETCFGFNP